ncbi:MAG: glycosyltransferase family 4 protein [Acidimicrobiales bacterium]
MPSLHQFVPTLDPGAVGSHIIAIQRALRDADWESEIFSEHTRSPYTGMAHRYTDYGRTVAAAPDDVLLYHAAIGSSVADWLMAEHRRKLVVDYHNITPPAWFDGWEPALAYGLGWGRAQLRRLSRRSRFGLADSAYNASELTTIGFRGTAVLPIFVPPDALAGEPDAATLDRLGQERGTRWLFVGRLAPNKRQHLLIGALAMFRKIADPGASLALVGGSSSPAYEQAIRRFAVDLGVADAVTITGAVSDGVRNAYYAAADVFVCLSAHEGFCVPILEAWHHGVPVVAFAAAAVPETLDGAGILLRTADAVTVATAVDRVRADPAVAGALRDAGTARLRDFAPDRTRARLLELASGLLSAP